MSVHEMERLNLPSFPLKIKQEDEKHLILDVFRKKYIQLTPEEWVRQNFAHYLVKHKHYPEPLISMERAIKISDKLNRSDLIAYNRNGKALLLVECKASSVEISQKTFDQIAGYNYKIGAAFLILTNGLIHYCCKVNTETKQYEFLNDIPDYRNIMHY
jgi:hypothetical protein